MKILFILNFNSDVIGLDFKAHRQAIIEQIVLTSNPIGFVLQSKMEKPSIGGFSCRIDFAIK